MGRSKRFKVQTAAVFLAASDVRKDAIQARNEERAKEQREMQRDTGRIAYQKSRLRMSTHQQIEDELTVINEMMENNAKNTARVEAAYQKLTKHSGGDKNGSR